MKNISYKTLQNYFPSHNSLVNNKPSVLDKMIRNNIVLRLRRTILYSQTVFKQINKQFFSDLYHILNKDQFDAIFVTIPDVYGIYIAEYVKSLFPNIPIITEIRDIINNKISKGNPSILYNNVEKKIIRLSDGIIALTKGISMYYVQKMTKNKVPIEIIYNGYDHNKFTESVCDKISFSKDCIRFSHIGSIYKGRNIGVFIGALKKIQNFLKKKIIFDIVGILDSQAHSEMGGSLINIDKNKLEINIIGALPHDEAIEKLKNCDIAVILTHKKGSEYAIPGKTFEYIGACKPIIAVTNDPPLIKLVNGKYGECATHEIFDIYQKILVMLDKKYNFDSREMYSRKNQATKITEFIEKIILNNITPTFSQ